MLSQVERGQREPTLPIAVKIAEGLGCHLSEILDERPDRPYGLLRSAEASGSLDPDTGVQRLLLSRHLPASIAEVSLYLLPPGASAGPFLHRDPDLLEQLTLVAGQLSVTVGETAHRLRAGDTLSYPGTEEHRFENVGRAEALVVHLAHPLHRR